jgi:hypothetical protein
MSIVPWADLQIYFVREPMRRQKGRKNRGTIQIGNHVYSVGHRAPQQTINWIQKRTKEEGQGNDFGAVTLSSYSGQEYGCRLLVYPPPISQMSQIR